MNYNYTHIVSKELTEKAIKMLLSGATLVSEPCPYCQGVRVIKDGFALCVNCGKQPEEKPTQTKSVEEEPVKPLKILEKKQEDLSKQLEKEVCLRWYCERRLYFLARRPQRYYQGYLSKARIF